MRSNLWLLVIVFSFPFSESAFSKNKLFHYEPEVVSLTGITTSKDYPGPPNYESIADGDEREGAVFLVLDNVIDVATLSSIPEASRDERENNVTILHVANHDDKYWPLLRDGHHIKITGMLFHRLTGHHRTQVLIDVSKVELIDKKRYIINANVLPKV